MRVCLLVACDVSLASPLDVMLNNKIAKITVNTDRATIKYFSNLVRVRHSVILCKYKNEERQIEKEKNQMKMFFR